jgi:hypothetical protein
MMTNHDDRDEDERYSDEAELADLRRLAAEVFDLEFQEPVNAGSQANLVGIRSAHLLFSRRIDSRTYFVHDEHYGMLGEAGAFQGAETEQLEACHRILDRLSIPRTEVASEAVLKEMTQIGRLDQETSRVLAEEPQEGKHIARLTRAIEGLPVWSSGMTLGLTSGRGVGYVQLHWPELSDRTLHEAHRLRYRIAHGWEAPPQPGAEIEEVQAGIIHSPAIAFIMDIQPVVRVVYRPAEGLRGQKPVLYLDRHGRPVPLPRVADMPAEPALRREAPAAQLA